MVGVPLNGFPAVSRISKMLTSHANPAVLVESTSNEKSVTLRCDPNVSVIVFVIRVPGLFVHSRCSGESMRGCETTKRGRLVVDRAGSSGGECHRYIIGIPIECAELEACRVVQDIVADAGTHQGVACGEGGFVKVDVG